MLLPSGTAATATLQGAELASVSLDLDTAVHFLHFCGPRAGHSQASGIRSGRAFP
jgi:hypothetical protein